MEFSLELIALKLVHLIQIGAVMSLKMCLYEILAAIWFFVAVRMALSISLLCMLAIFLLESQYLLLDNILKKYQPVAIRMGEV